MGHPYIHPLIVANRMHALFQEFPGDLLPSIYINPDNAEDVRARSELECRGKYIELLEVFEPALVELVKQCLHNAPQQRPSTDELQVRLQRMREEVEGKYGGGVVMLDMSKMKLVKELKMKNRMLEEQQVAIMFISIASSYSYFVFSYVGCFFLYLQERHETELDAKARELEDKTRELEDKTRELEDKTRELEDKTRELEDKSRRLEV